MSRKKKSRFRKQRDNSPTQASQSPSDQSGLTTSVAAAPLTSTTLMRVVVALGGLWWLILVTVAAFTANPVTLNRRQILQADLVVSGQVEDVEQGTVGVQKQWLRGEQLKSIRVIDLNSTGIEAGGTWLLPLSERNDGTYEITRGRSENLPVPDPPYIYPESSAATSQLEQILADRKR